MLKGFACQETRKIYEGRRSTRLPLDIQRAARRKLFVMDSATSLAELRAPPSNHLEALRGDRAGQHSIRINKQWRITFTNTPEGFDRAAIEDYH